MKTLAALCVLLSCSFARGDNASELRSFVDGWVAAQNRGDFDAYGSFYAKRLTGVRRSGSREVRLDRAGWMRDRARMFRKPMHVEVSDFVGHASATAAAISFVQTFAQGSYRDAGTKKLVLVREAGAWKISGEELLDSTLSAGAAVPSSAFWLADGIGLVLGTGQEAWVGAAAPSLVITEDRYTALRKVDAAKLPAAFAGRVGTAVEVLDEHGATCKATITALEVARSVVPHFGEVQEWKSDGTKPEAIAKSVLSATDADEDRLVAILAPACRGGLVGRPAGSAGHVSPRQPATEAERLATLAEIKRTKKDLDFRRSFAKADPSGAAEHKGNWATESFVDAFDVIVEGRRERWLSGFLLGGEGCSEWEPELSVLYRVTPGGLQAIEVRSGHDMRLQLAADLDGDGWPELVYSGGTPSTLDLVRAVRSRAVGEYGRLQELRVPYHDCPC